MIKFLMDYRFEYVANVVPIKDENSKIIGYNNYKEYKNWQTTKLNKYGLLTFCVFDLPNLPKESGVYALYENDELIYIGRAKDLRERWGRVNYGSISPRNCFVGGQSTNCKINNYIYESSRMENNLVLYFYKTKDYAKVEKELLLNFSNSLKLNKQKK